MKIMHFRRFFSFLSSDKDRLCIPQGHFTFSNNVSVDGHFPNLNANKKTWKYIWTMISKKEEWESECYIYFYISFRIIIIETVEIKICDFRVRYKMYFKFIIFVVNAYFTKTTINSELTILIKLHSRFE